jgi:FkbM family methyltransferase
MIRLFYFNALGSYGFYYSNYLKSLSHPFIFLDIGANQGLYSLISGKNTFCKTIIALEPVEQIFKILNRNFILNKIERESGINAALGDKSGRAIISYDPLHSGTSSLLEDTLVSKKCSNYEIDIICYKQLDEYLNFPDFDIIVKIDTEGYEEIVVNEILKSRFKKQIQSVFYEVNTGRIDHLKVQNILKEEGFKRFIKIGTSMTHFDVLALK